MIEPLIDSCENEDVKKTLRRKWMVNDQGSNILEASDAVAQRAVSRFETSYNFLATAM